MSPPQPSSRKRTDGQYADPAAVEEGQVQLLLETQRRTSARIIPFAVVVVLLFLLVVLSDWKQILAALEGSTVLLAASVPTISNMFKGQKSMIGGVQPEVVPAITANAAQQQPVVPGDAVAGRTAQSSSEVTAAASADSVTLPQAADIAQAADTQHTPDQEAIVSLQQTKAQQAVLADQQLLAQQAVDTQQLANAQQAAVPQQGTQIEPQPTAAEVPATAELPQTKVLVEIEHEGKKLQILDEPIPDYCYAEQHADYDGGAVQWGLGHKARSAAECCERCRTFKERNPEAPFPCNVWVWCGDPSGVCWTMDIHKHTTGDCWLKYQEGWDNNPDRRKTNLKINHRDKFPEDFRREHKTAPELVPWVAGVNPAQTASQ